MKKGGVMNSDGIHDDEARLSALTERIIGCAFKVSNVLGCGFLEKVYENALLHELRKNGLKAVQQQPINVHYDGVLVGEYFADILVEDLVIVEMKATSEHHEAFTAQCLNYLKATGKPICLLLNFGKPRVEIKRLRGAIKDKPPPMKTD
jgi:GxxExxY protein